MIYSIPLSLACVIPLPTPSLRRWLSNYCTFTIINPCAHVGCSAADADSNGTCRSAAPRSICRKRARAGWFVVFGEVVLRPPVSGFPSFN